MKEAIVDAFDLILDLFVHKMSTVEVKKVEPNYPKT